MNELPVGFITLGVLISTWICYAVGTAWRDTMVLNSSLNKLLLWSAVTHSCISFTMPFVIGLVWVLTMGEEPAMTPVKARQLMGGSTIPT